MQSQHWQAHVMQLQLVLNAHQTANVQQYGVLRADILQSHTALRTSDIVSVTDLASHKRVE